MQDYKGKYSSKKVKDIEKKNQTYNSGDNIVHSTKVNLSLHKFGTSLSKQGSIRIRRIHI